jgi:enoyl-CoA hydratase/carnithine racemase
MRACVAVCCLRTASTSPAVSSCRSGCRSFATATCRRCHPTRSIRWRAIPEHTLNKPLVIAVQGWCLTIGIELLLAADIRVAADNTRFAQIEIKRGIFPVGGATVRLVQEIGWGNAMRILLTGDEFSAADAFRTGLVQEVVAPGAQLERALSLAHTIARQSPVGVQATLASARLARREGEHAAFTRMMVDLQQAIASDDAIEGLNAFLERREPRF